MADRTLTINHADGGSETYTINRDKFAGVRDMTVDGETVSVDHTAVAKEQSKETTFGGSQSITVNRDIEPLLSKVVGGAAAAYSLRDLKDVLGNSNNVVRVRRSSDNAEKDFTASQISTGEMTNWVNSQIVPPLDIGVETADGRPSVPDGGTSIGTPAAAYSLRSLGEGQADDIVPSGDTVTPAAGAYVVQVRRSSGGNVKSFTADEVADGTLEDWVNVGKDYVGYAYFTDSNTANVALSSSFTLEASKSWSIKFEYIGGSTVTGLFGNSSFGNGGFWFANQHTIGLTDDTDTYQALSFGSGLALNLGKNYEIEFFNTPSEGVRVAIDGTTMVTTPKVYGDITINRVGLSRGRDGNRVIHNVRVDLNGDGTLDYSYAGDGNQASNWEDRVGSNDGTPTAQVSTYNNEFTDGYVRTWYDQSGSDNHAVQTTNASQPKIVDAGTLVTNDEGKPAIQGATGKNFDLSPNVTGIEDLSVFFVGEVPSAFSAVLGWENNLHMIRVGTNHWELVANLVDPGNMAWDSAITTGDTTLFNFTRSSGTVTGYANSAASATTTNANSNTFSFNRIFTRSNVNYNDYDGKASELIIYDSDQTDNRTALEANIGEHYGISGIPAYDNTVDGFVETWYDQSGNGNDATQTVTANQPKIVDAGTYLEEIDFPSSSATLGFSNIACGTTYSLFCALPRLDVSNFKILSDGGSAPRIDFERGSPDRIEVVDNNYGFKKFNTSIDFVNDDNLTSIINASTSVNVFYNGNASSTNPLTIPNANTFNTLGGQAEGGAYEVILYTSDQSANRPAIEANINNQYSIY